MESYELRWNTALRNSLAPGEEIVLVSVTREPGSTTLRWPLREDTRREYGLGAVVDGGELVVRLHAYTPTLLDLYRTTRAPIAGAPPELPSGPMDMGDALESCFASQKTLPLPARRDFQRAS